MLRLPAVEDRADQLRLRVSDHPALTPMEASLLLDVSDAPHHPHSGVERVSVETEPPYIVTP